MAKRQASGISELAKASIHRLEDARALIAAERWQGAMYLAGYAVECLLKTKLMRRYRCRTLTQLDELLHRKGRTSEQWSIYSHELVTMLNLLGCLERMQANRNVWRAFALVNQWAPAWRYSADLGTKKDADQFVDSVEQVVRWIEANT
jgi:HEPN domain-containing protein